MQTMKLRLTMRVPKKQQLLNRMELKMSTTSISEKLLIRMKMVMIGLEIDLVLLQIKQILKSTH